MSFSALAKLEKLRRTRVDLNHCWKSMAQPTTQQRKKRGEEERGRRFFVSRATREFVPFTQRTVFCSASFSSWFVLLSGLLSARPREDVGGDVVFGLGEERGL